MSEQRITVVVGGRTDSSLGRTFGAVTRQQATLGRNLQTNARTNRRTNVTGINDATIRQNNRQTTQLINNINKHRKALIQLGRTSLRVTRRILARNQSVIDSYRAVASSASENSFPALRRPRTNAVGNAARSNARPMSGSLGVGGLVGGVAVGAGAVQTGRQLVDLEYQLKQLQVQTGLNDAQMQAYKQQMKNVGLDPNIKLDFQEVLDATQEIVTRTGDMDLAANNLRTLALTTRGQSSTGRDIGGLVSEGSTKFGIKTQQDIESMLAILIEQGKAGAFELKNLAESGATAISAYSATGRTGLGAVTELGALLQVAMSATGQADRAVTTTEAALSDLIANVEKVEDLGVDVYDPKDASGTSFRSVPDIFKDIITATNGNLEDLGDIFQRQSIRLLNKMVTDANSQKKDPSKTTMIDLMLATSANKDTIEADSQAMASTMSAALDQMGNVWTRFADDVFAPRLSAMANFLSGIDPDTLNSALDVGLVGAGLYGAYKVGRGALGAVQALRGARGDGSGSSNETARRVQRVYVTNWRNGGNTDTGGGRSGRGRSLMSGLGRAAGALGVAVGVGSIASTLASDELTGAQQADLIGEEIGGIAGSLGGAYAGAALGTMLLPGVGTLIGGALGSAAGYFGGSAALDSIGDAVFGDSEAAINSPIDNNLIQQANSTGTNVQNDNVFNITQLPNEDGEQFANRVASLMDDPNNNQLRDG